jgi:hypothetical protein
MNTTQLSVNQLKRALAVKQRIDSLSKELQRILGNGSNSAPVAAKNKRTMSAAARKRIAAAQKARWAKLKASNKSKPAAGSASKSK